MNATGIEWADRTWNPVTGCSPVSEGCERCYAKLMAETRLRGRCGYDAEDPFKPTFHYERLAQVTPKQKPQRIFVCSMGDLFHEQVRRHWVVHIMTAIATCEQHEFVVLTKRPGAALSFIQWFGHVYPNLTLGVSVENQARADERIPILMQIPAARRIVSVEPMLGPVDLDDYMPWAWERKEGDTSSTAVGLDGVICGAETGRGARPMDLDWARDLRDQCVAEGVPFVFKRDSDGNHELYGQVWEQWPEAQR